MNDDGLYVTIDDVVKLTTLLQHGGQHQGQQLLSAAKLAEALELPEAPLPVDPYVLGCWLGWEHAGKAAMATPKSDRSHFGWEFQRAGYRLEDPAALPRKARQRIPVPYLRASFKQRLALLQGIMDTAGRVRNAPAGAVELCLRNRDVAAGRRSGRT